MPLMKMLLGFLFLAPAFAQPVGWHFEDGAAFAEPAEGNSNILRIEISCGGEPYRLAVYTDHGPVLTANGEGEADYFYETGRIEAEVDGIYFPLVAAGSEDAVVLFAEGTAEQNFLADLDQSFVSTLQEGGTLTLAFDITPAPNAETDSPFETFARFPLEGAGQAIGEALGECTS